MDPKANIQEQIELAKSIIKITDQCPEDGEFLEEQKDDICNDAIRLAELVLALDEWIQKGGFVSARMLRKERV